MALPVRPRCRRTSRDCEAFSRRGGETDQRRANALHPRSSPAAGGVTYATRSPWVSFENCIDLDGVSWRLTRVLIEPGFLERFNSPKP